MKRLLIVLVVLTLFAAAAAAPDPELERELPGVRQASKIFTSSLSAVLSDSLEEEGAVEAIGVCQETAPEIAKNIFKETGYEVGRTALKVRNAENAPDAWEKKILKSFDKKMAKGTDPSGLEHIEIVTEGEDRVVRYMKAIPTGGFCLTCHGSDLELDLAEKIGELYPKDQATGFKEGKLRGALTIRKVLEPLPEEPAVEPEEVAPKEEVKPAPEKKPETKTSKEPETKK